jgi:hypothetical protein
MLTYFWRSEGNYFQLMKQEVLKSVNEGGDLKELIRLCIIPKILLTAVRESPVKECVPIVLRYALSRGFNVKEGDLVMNECGWHGSHLSEILHLLRAGVCASIVAIEGVR